MGARKRNRATQRKEAKKSISFAELRNCPTSPTKMRLVADQIRGLEVNKALDILRHSPKHASIPLEKLVMSAIANWQAKNEKMRMEEAGLYIKVISVDGGRTLKRIKPAAQGRAYRIRKRSNHVYVEVASSYATEVEEDSLIENEN
ncbi:MAG: 50S ribosomal protein L22 [Bacteroidales bacterium]|nr:50S ribosomal protein L22 [Bacteroidales bacterium]